MPLATIEAALEDFKQGKFVIIVDDEDRENEGDFVCAAEKVTPEIINFMATHGRGLICAPLIEDRCEKLGLEMMVGQNTAAFETPFTVSVDLIGHGCTTGISASDRAKTIKALLGKIVLESIEPSTGGIDLNVGPYGTAGFISVGTLGSIQIKSNTGPSGIDIQATTTAKLKGLVKAAIEGLDDELETFGDEIIEENHIILNL